MLDRYSCLRLRIVRVSCIGVVLVAGVAQSSHSQPTLKDMPQPLQQGQNCLILRPLNPTPQDNYSRHLADAEDLGTVFANAFKAANSGQFHAAIYYYKKAFSLAQCPCDKLHAKAGIQAASEAGNLLEKAGWRSRPTQVFWSELQLLTRGLACVKAE